jgi:hypothetical protein
MQMALATNSEDTTALCNRGVVLRELKRFDEALASLNKAIALKTHLYSAVSIITGRSCRIFSKFGCGCLGELTKVSFG